MRSHATSAGPSPPSAAATAGLGASAAHLLTACIPASVLTAIEATVQTARDTHGPMTLDEVVICVGRTPLLRLSGNVDVKLATEHRVASTGRLESDYCALLDRAASEDTDEDSSR